jgi:hypothetical protein
MYLLASAQTLFRVSGLFKAILREHAGALRRFSGGSGYDRCGCERRYKHLTGQTTGTETDRP